MRAIILTKGGSVIWNGRLISRENIHELPTEADWAIATNSNLNTVQSDLENELKRIQEQLKVVEAAKVKVPESAPVEKVPEVKVEGEEPASEVVISSRKAKQQ